MIKGIILLVAICGISGLAHADAAGSYYTVIQNGKLVVIFPRPVSLGSQDLKIELCADANLAALENAAKFTVVQLPSGPCAKPESTTSL